MITVTQLIEQLGKFPKEVRVVVRGYELGVDDIKLPRLVNLALDINEEDYEGPHDIVEQGMPAVFISDVRRDSGSPRIQRARKPLIVRVALCDDWMAAFRLVWEATFGRIAADHAPPMEYLKWSGRRGFCLSYAERCADEYDDKELADAWATLGAEPAGPKWRTPEGHKIYLLVFASLAAAIVADPALLDDQAFAEAINGWLFLERAGSDGEDDLIAAARRYSAMVKIDKAEILAWARSWAQARP